MARIVTEVVTVPFKPDADTDNILEKVIATISAQEGFLGLKWGRWEEEECNVQMMIHWTDITAHERFMTGPDYPGMLGLIDGLTSGPPSIIHVHFNGDSINKVLEGPVVELVTFYAIGGGFEEAVSKTMAVGTASEGCLGFARGDVVEEIAVKETEAKGKAHFAAVAWTSAQARVEASGREEVKESGVGVVSRIGGYEMHHVKFQ